MRKILVLSLFGSLGLSALLINISCNTTAPSSTNFQSPLQTLVAINPTLTPTSTATNSPTNTPTDTPTETPTDTPTPTPT